LNGFLVDTNVLSELARPEPEPAVVAWVGGVDAPLLFLSVLTLGELQKGISAHPDANRRARLSAWVDGTLRPWFDRRVLPVDRAVAERWGALSGVASRAGRPLPVIDGLLAATALHHGLTLVTRNVADVAATGTSVLCPWPDG
jgi:predicted nucleic acid-binding protein